MSRVQQVAEAPPKRPVEPPSAGGPDTTTTAADDAALSIEDYAMRAAAVLPQSVWDFVAGGSGAEATLAANERGFAVRRLVPRVLRDVSVPAPQCELFGGPLRMPAAVAPMAYQRLVHPDGELAAARAARTAGIPFIAGMLSSVSLEDIAATGATLWFQVYWLRDRAVLADLLARAAAAGARAIVLTVDTPRMGRRLRDVRNQFALPSDVTAANLSAGPTMAHRARSGVSAVSAHTSLIFDPSLTWADLDWVRARTSLPLLLKGILDPDDASRAADSGVDAIVTSNHGGRQLDGAISTIDALPEVLRAVDQRCPVLLDGGVRGGVDVLKAIAQGARAVLLGRPVLWGLAVGGERGVTEVLSLIRDDLVHAMALAGCPDLEAARRLRLMCDQRAVEV
jgi:4-hydroxymandelate oxidase